MDYPIVVTLSGPDSTRAKAELALETAHLPVIPADHYSVGRKSYDPKHWGHLAQLPSGQEPDEQHSFIAVLAESEASFHTSYRVVEQFGWVLRVHYELPQEPQPDPIVATLAEMRQKIAELEQRVGGGVVSL